MSDALAPPNLLYYGDNLGSTELAEVRRYVEDESVDLIYLDPPFTFTSCVTCCP